METLLTNSQNFILDILFPKFCLGCQKEGSYLCNDCLSTIEIIEYLFCPGCQKREDNGRPCKSCRKFIKLDRLYFATSYQNSLVKELINKFKHEPLVKELAKPITFLIITHFQIIEKPDFSDCSIIPVPLEKSRLKWRGFNQAEEIAKELANFLNIKVWTNVLVKTKRTFPQVEIENKNKRKENVIGIFSCQNSEKIKNKKILLVDDVYTTGSTMNEAAKTLKEGGARAVWGVAVARG